MMPPSQMAQLAGAMSVFALFVFGVPDVYRSIAERRERNEVLARGKSAVASVQQRSGADSIMISWIDSVGKRRSTEALIGKAFARSPPQRFEIKYVDDLGLRPVVLSQVAERDRINNFYFYWHPLFFLFGGFVLFGAFWLSTKLYDGSRRNV
jgi:hypothetical protein